MAIRLVGLIFWALFLSACAGADFPGFVDATVEVTTGVDLQDRLDDYMEAPDPNANRVGTISPQGQIAGTGRDNTAPAPSDSRSLLAIFEQYADWSALVIAADYRAASGADTEAFDNTRRAVAAHLEQLGFDPRNIAQFSVRPERYNEPALVRADYDNIRSELRRLRRRADDGCLVYMTSHGDPDGISIGADGKITPEQLNELLTIYCGSDPTILVVSACYSGIFAMDEMLLPNRFIMTASRSDRTSFGCGEGDTYPYFDACFLETFPNAGDWLDLARSTRTCIEARELAQRLSPPSSPQIYVGPEIRDVVLTPFLAIDYGPPQPGS